MTKNGHAVTAGDRVAFTIRIDRDLLEQLETARAALGSELHVRLSKNDFWERLGREFIAARTAAAAPPRAARRA